MSRSLRKRLFQLFLLEVMAVLFGMSAGAFGQDNEWSLKRCLEFAIENSLSVEQAQLGIDNAEISSKLAKSQRYPSLSFNTNLGLNFGRTVDPTTNDFITTNFLSNGAQFNTAVTLYNGGRINNQIKSALQEEKATKEDLNSSMINLAFDIAQTYFNALLARENVQNITVQRENTISEIERMSRMIEVGTRAQAEIYDLEAQLATTDQDLAMAQNSFDISMVGLKALMNISFDIEMILVEPNMAQSLYSDPDVLTFEEAYSKALEFSPSNKAQKFRIKSAEYDLKVSKAGMLPSLSAGGNINTNYSNQAKQVVGFTSTTVSQPVTIDGVPALLGTDQAIPQISDKTYGSQFNDNLFYGFGVSLNIPIYSNYQNKANVDRSKVNLETLINQNRQNDNNLRNTMQQLLTDARGAKRALEASEKTLRAREIAAQNAEKRFQVGALNSFDYISIQNQYNQALINLSISKYDYLYKIKILDYYQGYPVEF
jgi:outer membrane protein